MTILYVLKSFAQLAGTERVMADKINYLAKQRHNLILVTYEQGSHSLAFQLDSSVKHIDINTRFFTLSKHPVYTRFFYYLKLKRSFQKKFQHITNQVNPDFIITTTYSLKIADAILNAKGKAQTIIESHVSHDSVLREYDFTSNSILRFFAKIYDKHNLHILKNYNFVIALTQKDAAKWRMHVNNVIVIPNPLTNYPDSIEVIKAINHRIIAVGRLNHQKGFDKLINAFAIIKDKFPSWHLDIFGKGELHDILQKQICRLGLSNHISLKSPTTDIYNEYLNSDFYVLSSNFEGFGLVLIEAMACGLPCISFNCPYGPDEIITDGKDGILVKNGDTKELAEKMAWMIMHDDERHLMGIHARITAKSYEIESIMSQWIDLFNHANL